MSQALIETATSGGFREIIFAKLPPRADLMLGIKEVARKHNIRNAIILSCIGSLEKVTFGYAILSRDKSVMLGQDKHWQHDEPVSMLSGQGIIAPDTLGEHDLAVHLHGTFQTNGGTAIGQHIEDLAGGSIVFNTTELVVGSLDISVARRFDEEVGTPVFGPVA